MDTDSYHTVKEGAIGTFKEKGSKFIAISKHVQDEDEFKIFLHETKKKYYDARHHCYAWVLGLEDNRSRSNDDGEPSGSAGKPILNQLLSKKLFNTAVIVVRYFGGTKLGVSGLIAAYKTSTKEALDNSTIVKRFVYNTLELRFNYPRLSNVMRIVKEEDLIIAKQQFEAECLLRVKIKKNDTKRIFKRLSSFHDISIITL
jgi:uncharacterized YigZ family protein